jgi:hypothetical protein
MKKIFTKIGLTLLIIVVIPLFIILVVGTLPMIILSITLDWWRKLFVWLRHDPEHKTPKQYHIYTDNNYPEGKEALSGYFEKFVAVIKKDVGTIEVADINIEELGDNQGEYGDSHGILYSTTLQTSTSKASIEMQACGDLEAVCGVFTALQDGDIPPYLNVIYTQSDGLRTVFNVSGYDSLEFLVASLQHGQTVSDAGQIWTMLRKGLYIVNYSMKKSEKSDRIGTNYGYRKSFSDAKTRMYFFDNTVKPRK